MELEIRHNTFRLLPQKAMLWCDTDTLILSDLHLGKVSHFRKEGIAVPAKALEENFIRLHRLMQDTQPGRVIITGDLFHSERNSEWDLFYAWRQEYMNTEIHMVMGNHEILPRSEYEQMALLVHDVSLVAGPFMFVHHPVPEDVISDYYAFAGHIHPVIRLYGQASQSFRLPCFHISPAQTVLPSFGYFTGGHPVRPVNGDRVIAIVNDKLMDVSQAVT